MRRGPLSPDERKRRQLAFVRLVAAGTPLREAADTSRFPAERVLELIEDRDTFEAQVEAVRVHGGFRSVAVNVNQVDKAA